MTAGNWDAYVDSIAPRMHRQSADADFLPQIEAWMRASDQETAATAMRSLLEADLRPLLPSIRRPVLVLMSYDPAIIPLPKETYLLAAQMQYAGLPNKEVRLVEGARHFIMHDARERFLAETTAFLAE
jgi:pimeloyl-ACP methyl ester carboxylesterase